MDQVQEKGKFVLEYVLVNIGQRRTKIFFWNSGSFKATKECEFQQNFCCSQAFSKLFFDISCGGTLILSIFRKSLCMYISKKC